MILLISLFVCAGLFLGFWLGIEVWERFISPIYDEWIRVLLTENRRLRAELSRRDKTVEGDEWKDG